jgi:hypothetical protein
MGIGQPAASEERQPFQSGGGGANLNLALIAGLALLGLGIGLFGLGIYHGFENGSCSTTGYAGHYGPVQHCAGGVGWWMLMLMVGLVAAGGGAAISGAGQGFGIPALFVAIGAPFIALGLRGGNTRLLLNASSSSGKISAIIFGACFMIGGLVWGARSASGSDSSLDAGALAGPLLGCVVGLGVAFAIAAGVSSAIGTAPTTAKDSRLARENQLGACVTAAGSNTPQIIKCEAKYGAP